MYKKIKEERITNTCEGEQNKPLGNRLCWPIANFELEVLEEKQVQGGPFDLTLSL